MSSKNGNDKPIFELDDLSYRWQQDYLDANLILGAAIKSMADFENSSGNDVMTLKAQRRDAEDERQRLALQAIVSVPRSWLIRSAPDDLQWDSIEAFDYLRADKAEPLFTAIMTELQGAAGN